MKLRRLGAGLYVTEDGRYTVERQENVTECTHPNCDQLHQRFIEDGVHWAFYYPWIVWDNVRDDYASRTHFDTRRDAVAWLETHRGNPLTLEGQG